LKQIILYDFNRHVDAALLEMLIKR